MVEISTKTDPPICKVLDYPKFKYEQEKKKKQIKAKAGKNTIVKEIQLTLNTAKHDLEVKKRHAAQFLQDGTKLKIQVLLRGREIRQQGEAREILEKLIEDLALYGKVETPASQPTKNIKTEGNKVVLIMVPTKQPTKSCPKQNQTKESKSVSDSPLTDE